MQRKGSDFGTRPKTEDLETFLAVADEGSLAGAARSMGIPKSTVNRRLNRLEEGLGVRLLVRSSRRVAVTDAGARIVERTREVLADVDAVIDQAIGTRTEPRGRLRVSAPDDLASHTAVWAGFMETQPDVELQLEFTNRHIDVIREGLDLALRGGPGSDAGLIARRVGTYRLRAVASPEYTDRHGRLESAADLRTRSAILLKPFDTPSESGRRHLVANDLGVVLDATRRGLGVAVLPAALVQDDLDAGRLVGVLGAYAPLEVPLYAVYPNRRYLPAAAVAFIDHVREAFPL